MNAWLRFFRIVNLPTVPGDVLVGAAAIVWGVSDSGLSTTAVSTFPWTLAGACVASCFLYLFGLADNDIVGVREDGPERPIPAGEISLGAARIARGLCLFLAVIVGAVANLPPAWWIVAFALTLAMVAYNRTKRPLLMGLCRGLNVACGGAALIVKSWRGVPGPGRAALLLAATVATLYIALVTKYSEGEETDPAKRRFVGVLIGAITYLQLGVLLAFYLLSPGLALRNLLLIGAALLILLRLLKRTFPRVSAS